MAEYIANEYLSKETALWIAALTKAPEETKERLTNWTAADVQPVKRGKWLHDRKTQWKCSECGNFLDFDGLNCGRGSAFYCPNCGAKMSTE